MSNQYLKHFPPKEKMLRVVICLAPFLGDLSQSEKLSGIKLPLFRAGLSVALLSGWSVKKPWRRCQINLSIRKILLDTTNTFHFYYLILIYFIIALFIDFECPLGLAFFGSLLHFALRSCVSPGEHDPLGYHILCARRVLAAQSKTLKIVSR